MKNGELRIEWFHAEGCPANDINILTERWGERYRICECGMPSNFELSALEETACISWAARVDNGETDRETG